MVKTDFQVQVGFKTACSAWPPTWRWVYTRTGSWYQS